VKQRLEGLCFFVLITTEVQPILSLRGLIGLFLIQAGGRMIFALKTAKKISPRTLAGK
jgi:hypothetical protein